MGMTFWELLCRKIPFVELGNDEQAIMRAISNGRRPHFSIYFDLGDDVYHVSIDRFREIIEGAGPNCRKIVPAMLMCSGCWLRFSLLLLLLLLKRNLLLLLLMLMPHSLIIPNHCLSSALDHLLNLQIHKPRKDNVLKIFQKDMLI